MSKARALAGSVIIIAGALALPLPVLAQAGYTGPRGPNTFLQNLETVGPNTQSSKADDQMIKEAKKRFSDADPRVRVEGLEKLRYVRNQTDSTEMLERGLNDLDVRVRIKAIDVLGARGVNDVVPLMAQRLFLRQTPAIEKLHLVAALGRIGDSRGTLPILEYLDETRDQDSRGTAVFALGEIGDPQANDKLIQIVQKDKSSLVRRLAQEALEKIDGELPNHRQEVLEAERKKELEPTDEKLSQLRALDAQLQKARYGEDTTTH
ncbi:MAG TPA: HEAT repeat domain-containing protein [Candidatus Binataceae bacterium]|nr:HEAT repeat domain-containing protein [Candidatus Binataceae bacterium]